MTALPLDPLTVPLTGVRLVEASAGTGKTYTITGLHLRLLVERGLRVGQILVVTFTRAATAELKDRLRRRLREALTALADPTGADDTLRALVDRWTDRAEARRRLEAALLEVDDAAVFTIHGFCQRMLQEFAFESGARVDVELVEDERPLIAEVLADFWADEVERSPPQIVRHLVRTRVSPDSLLPLAATVVGDPSLRVVPDADGLLDDRAALDAITAWKAAHQAALATWWAERDAIVALLSAAPLWRSVYRPKTVERDWARRLDRTFAETSTGPEPLPDFFEKLTPPALVRYTKKGAITPRHRFFDRAGALFDAHAATRGPVDAWILRFRRRMVDAVRARAAAAKEQSRLVAYGDLLHKLAAALDRPDTGDRLAARIRERYPAALIDEFQDTDPVQYRIFHRVHADATLFLIGDPKQAIYGFRGADVAAYLEARDDAEAAYTLATNWRSDPGLLDGIAALFAHHPAPFLDPRIGFVGVGPQPDARERLSGPGAPVELVLVPRRPRWVQKWRSPLLDRRFRLEVYPECLAAEVVRLLHRGATIDRAGPGEPAEPTPVRPGDIAVLVRTNRQARALHAALQRHGVPAALQGDASVFESPEARDIEALLAALADPGDRAAVRGALVSRLVGLDAHALLEAQQDEAVWEVWSGRVHRWAAIQVRRGFLQAFRTVLAEADAPERILGHAGGERVLTNLLHLSELLQQVATELRLGTAGLLHWLRRAMTGDRQGLDNDAGQLRLESDAGAVELVTVHRSKGLEYPIVFAPYLWSGVWVKERDPFLRFHDPAADGRLTLDLGGPGRAAHLPRARAEDLAEMLRLTYVALTRAKHRAIVYWGAFDDFDTSALGWLLHPPPTESAWRMDGGDHTDPVGALQAGLDEVGDRTLRDALDAVAGRSPAVAVRLLSDDTDVRWLGATDDTEAPAARTPTRTGLRAQRTGSYSALVRGAPAADVADHDAGQATVGLAAGEGPEVPLAAFPRGPDPGTALHAVLEEIDFAAPPDGDTVGAILARFGVDAAWGDPVAAALPDILAAPLGDGAPPMSAIGDQRLVELAFTLPVRDALTPAALADVFRVHGDPWVASTADRVAELGFVPLQGFLRGVIDLVFAHDGRWWLADHKSNHLGDHAGDYRDAALRQSMTHHHYVLQYHLYLVALHRFLRHRIRGYRYDTHVGGARYLFLRGMSPAWPGNGVFADRPSAALVDALDRLLG